MLANKHVQYKVSQNQLQLKPSEDISDKAEISLSQSDWENEVVDWYSHVHITQEILDVLHC